MSEGRLNKEVVVEALRPIRDPEIGLSIVELNMVRNVEINDGTVSLEIALTVAGCPLQKTIESDVRRILSSMSGVNNIQLKMGAMTKEEQQALAAQLKKKRESSMPPGATEVAPGIYRYGKMDIQFVVGIVSGKGGVGKSLVTGLLATKFAAAGYAVGVLDADITGPSMAKVLGVEGRASATETKLVPAVSRDGIKVLSMNLILEKRTQAVVWRGPLVTRAIIQMYAQAEWGKLHFLLIDLPPGTSDAQLTVFQSIPLDGIVIVTTPQSLAHMIVEKALDMARVTKVPVLGVVENMSFIRCPHCNERIELYPRAEMKEEEMLRKLDELGSIPFDPAIAELADAGRLRDYDSKEATDLARHVREKLLEMKPASSTPIAWETQ
ncbi:MAG: Mrp/NBP35 family ATP-binding protein [Methanomassiliicoccales archaeon]